MRRVTLGIWICVICVTAVVSGFSRTGAVQSIGQSAGQSEIKKRFIGTWRLISIEPATSNLVRGARPIGVIYYDATGHMAVQIMPDRPRPAWTGSPTPEQAKEALTGYTAYFGTYSVDERAQTVTHHREGMLVPGPVDFVRKYEFVGGDRLILTPVESTNRLTWELIK